MKVKRGDKVVLFNVKNVYGVDYQCYYGTLQGIRELYGNKVYKIKARRLELLVGETDMKNKELEVSSQVFTLRLWNSDTKAQLFRLKSACMVLHTTLAKITPKRASKQHKNV